MSAPQSGAAGAASTPRISRPAVAVLGIGQLALLLSLIHI